MRFSVLNNFQNIADVEGYPSKDTHGNFILFPMDLSDIIDVGTMLKSQSGEMIQLTELDYDLTDGIRKLKMYY